MLIVYIYIHFLPRCKTKALDLSGDYYSSLHLLRIHCAISKLNFVKHILYKFINLGMVKVKLNALQVTLVQVSLKCGQFGFRLWTIPLTCGAQAPSM